MRKCHISDSQTIERSQSGKAWVNHVTPLQANQRANLSIFLCISYTFSCRHEHKVIWIFLHQSTDDSNLFQAYSDCIHHPNRAWNICRPKLGALKHLLRESQLIIQFNLLERRAVSPRGDFRARSSALPLDYPWEKWGNARSLLDQLLMSLRRYDQP